jgi:Uma2 family endonuclease
MYQINPTHPVQPPLPPHRVQQPLPTMYDLPSEDPEEPGLPDEFHDFQPQLLRETYQPTAVLASDCFIGTNLNLYYDSRHTQWHKRPDWFLVLGVPRATEQADLRWSYVVWQEGVNPFLVVELLSPGTEAEDLGHTIREINQPPGKWEVYERILRIPYYAIFDRYNNQFRLFQLVATQYQAVELKDAEFWFSELGLGLKVWQGTYQEATGLWLRWYDAQHNWIPTLAEQVVQEQQLTAQAQQQVQQEKARAEQERARAEQERLKAERLAERLRALGIDPNEV